MKLIDIKPNDTQLWSTVWSLYISSFPEHERRGAISHLSATTNRSFITKAVVDESSNLLALLFYWKIKDLIYIEHLAVNPKNRGSNIGTKIMQIFLEEHREFKIILEIEPTLDEITHRRLRFYKKLGFTENPYEYTHPSYTRDQFIHSLDILSYPKQLTELEYDKFCRFISDVVLTYIE